MYRLVLYSLLQQLSRFQNLDCTWFPVTIAVAFALAVTLPIVKLTLLPVTEKFASADIVTVPVPKFNLDPLGKITALPIVVTLPTDVLS